MIGKVLYRESVHGVLNYVLGKQGMTVLDYKNACSENISQRFFGDILHFRDSETQAETGTRILP